MNLDNYLPVESDDDRKEHSFPLCDHKSNVQLEINETELTLKGLEMLQKPEELKESKASVDVKENLELSLMKSYGFPVRLKFSLCKGSNELFFQKVTFPLLQSTKDLKQSQDELCQLLLRKDQEIQEYKEEGGRIALRHLKTPKFDKTKHLSVHKAYSNSFAFQEIPDSLLDQINNVNVAIKQEPEDIKPIVEYSALQVKREASPVAVKQEILSSQPSKSSLVSPRKRPRKLMNL